jgi:polyhydroxybutyrate depolymerase
VKRASPHRPEVRRRLALPLVAALMLLAAPAGAGGCGAAPEPACEVPLGLYRIALPEGVQSPPALVFLHGWGQSADVVMANAGLREALARRGYALIAPDGIATGEALGRKSWDVLRRPGRPRDDIAFLRAVVGDAAARHGVDRDRILLAGFSTGGTMAWNVACLAPGLARAYAPVGGALWEPMPARCAGPVDLFHVHGWTDRVVPLEGRPLSGPVVQGDVWKSLAKLREAGGCGNLQPDTATAAGDSWERRWTGCAGGSILLSLHPGGHLIPRGWLGRALDWFEGLPRRACLVAAGRRDRGAEGAAGC